MNIGNDEQCHSSEQRKNRPCRCAFLGTHEDHYKRTDSQIIMNFVVDIRELLTCRKSMNTLPLNKKLIVLNTIPGFHSPPAAALVPRHDPCQPAPFALLQMISPSWRTMEAIRNGCRSRSLTTDSLTAKTASFRLRRFRNQLIKHELAPPSAKIAIKVYPIFAFLAENQIW